MIRTTLHSDHQLRARGLRCRGLTLIELTVVLVLVGVMFSFILPNLSGVTPKYRLRTYARHLGASISEMRIYAIGGGKTTGLRYLLDDNQQGFQRLPPAPPEDPEQPMAERQSLLTENPPTGVRFRGVILPGQRGMISRGAVNVGFLPSGITGSHIAILEADIGDGQKEVLTIKFNSLSGIVDYYNHEVDFQHHES